MARKKKQVPPSLDGATLDPEDSEKTRREDERGRTVLAMVGKAIQGGSKILLQWHPIRRVPTGDHKCHFSTYIGVVVRERVSITYKEWSEVPNGLLDEVYESISKGFYVIENRRSWVLVQASKRWKAFKTRLRLEWMYLEDGAIRQQPPWKYPWINRTDWDIFVKNCTSNEFKLLSEMNRERAKKKTSKYRGGRLGYQYFEEQIEKDLEKQGVHVSYVPRHLTWIKAHSHVKDGVVTFENPVDKEFMKQYIALEAQAQRGEIIANGRDDILSRALNRREHGGSVRAVGSGITNKEYFEFNKPTAPSQLHAEMNMMRSEMGTMKHNQNFFMSAMMSCLNQEQLRSFMTICGQFGGFGGQVGQSSGFGGQADQFGGHVGKGYNFGGQAGSHGQVISGGQAGGQAGFGGLDGNGLRIAQLDNSANHGLANFSFTQLLTGGFGRQGSKGHHFTHNSSEARSQDDAYIAWGFETQAQETTSLPMHQVRLQSPEAEVYHVQLPETHHTNPLEHSTNIAHQNNHLDITNKHTFPEGWSDCCLAIEGDDKGLVIVANGQVYIHKTAELISNHGAMVPPGARRVTITEDIVPNAPLPYPNDELVFVCQAKGSYTAWPIHLILQKKASVQPEKEVTTPSPRSVTAPSPRTASSQASTNLKYVITVEDREKVTTSWLQVLKTRAIGMRKRSETISLSIPRSVFLNEHAIDVTLDYEDMLDWCFLKEIGPAHLNIFMKHLKERCQEEGISGMYGFCDSSVLSPLTPTVEEEDRSIYLARVFGCNEGKNLNQLFFAPYNENRQWMLAIISPWNGLVYWLDPAGVGKEILEFAKMIINEGIIKFSITNRKDVRKIKKNPRIGWKQPQCPCQPQNNKVYGYYVCRYMLEILEKRVLWISDQFFAEETYSSEKVDEVRDIWVEYLLKQENEADEENKDDGMQVTQ
ncbi:hypothetical protein OROMI_022546 [Orobanche minor]